MCFRGSFQYPNVLIAQLACNETLQSQLTIRSFSNLEYIVVTALNPLSTTRSMPVSLFPVIAPQSRHPRVLPWPSVLRCSAIQRPFLNISCLNDNATLRARWSGGLDTWCRRRAKSACVDSGPSIGVGFVACRGTTEPTGETT